MINNLLLVKEKKENIEPGFTVPRHPEFVFLQELSESSWQARNAQTQKILRIIKKDKGEYSYYSFQ